ncbi:MAG: hypothetical protein AB7O88_14110 [Reyranellaceae bacterium]
MAGRIRIEPYKPLDINTSPVPGGGYIRVDASAGRFSPSPLTQLGLQAAEGAAAIATVAAHHFATDNEAVVKAADTRLSETEQALLFDPQAGYLNRQGQDALTQAPAVLEAYRAAQDRELAATANDDQHQMLRQLNERRLASFNTVVERHGAAERLRWHDQAGDNRIALMQADAALHWSDDALLRRALGTVRAEVREKAGRHAWDTALTESALRQQTSRTLASAITAAVDRDPDRAQDLRTRYDHHIEPSDRAPLDAMLAEAQVRARAQRASAEILNATPPEGHHPTPWQLQQAEAIAEPAVRVATVRTLRAAAAAADARARTLAEQVLTRVLKGGLTDFSQIPVNEWVALAPDRRRAIETRIDHNAAGTEPPANPALVDELATQMTEALGAFARRDLVPSVAHLPLPQWQRFRDLQAGVRRNDPAIEDEVYAIKRGLQLASKFLPADTPDDFATGYRAELVDEVDTWRRVAGKSPHDAAITDMLRRIQTEQYIARSLESDPRFEPEYRQLAGGDTTTYGRALALWRAMITIVGRTQGREAMRQAMRSLPKIGDADQIDDLATAVELVPAKKFPARINPNGQTVYYDPQRNRFVVRNLHGNGFWVVFDEDGRVIGTFPLGDLDTPVPRTAQPDDLEELWQIPPFVPPTIPPPVYPGRPIDRPRPPTILKGPDIDAPRPPTILEGPNIDAPRPPTILTGPDIDAAQPPTIYESRERPRHHNIPQFLWNPNRKSGLPPRFKFRKEVRDFFADAVTEIPHDEHWDYLHKAYNAVAERAMRAYLKQAKDERETEEQFAWRMSRTQAEECYAFIVHYILNPPATDDEAEARDNTRARAFLLNVFRYEKKKKR